MQRFLLDPSIIFLNHGSFGACPREVLRVCHAWQAEMEANPVEFLGRRSAALLAAARAELGRYLGARAEDLAFVANATHGVNIVARSLPLEAGDEVLATDHEYGACEGAWEFATALRGARYVRAEIPLPFRRGEFADRVWEKVTDRTRVLFLSHVTSTTALIFPVAELCRRARAAGILTVIDGAHVPGQLDLDLTALGADFYTGNCHKWLCAPKGSAFLHVRPEHQAVLEAPAVSWGYLALPANDAYTGTTPLERKLQWQGTRDLSAFLSVPAAIAFQERNGWEAERVRCHALVVETLHRVCAATGLPPPAEDADFGQMAIIPVPAGDAAALQEGLLRDHRIEVPVTSHKGSLFVRMSAQAYNTPRDADALVAALTVR